MKFLEGLDNDLRLALLAQLRDLWTHNSTALEGNTLTLGETAFVLSEGLTISGKPLKDHQEVAGHAKAIELLYHFLNSNQPISEEHLFALHKAVQTSIVIDIYQPIGKWKCEPNGTYALTKENKQTFIDYASPFDVPILMKEWLKMLNDELGLVLDDEKALMTYSNLHLAFVRIHPFADGNGRMARLIANLPVLKSGFPPILIDRQKRRDYLLSISTYDLEVGCAKKDLPLLPDSELKDAFVNFCKECWQDSMALVDEIHLKQRQRNNE